MKISRSMVLAGASLLVVAGLHGQAFAGTDVTWRLFVAEHGKPLVRVIDAADGREIDSFATASPAALFASQSGKLVFAVQRDGNRVGILASGIAIDDHGGHGDLNVTPPKMLDIAIEGERPVHFVDHHGNIALFFDGEGGARVVEENDLLDSKPAIREIKTDAPHHGVAISYGDRTVVTWPNRQDPSKNPDGVRVVDANGAQVGPDVDCPNLHGEASSGNILAIACQTGLLLVTEKGGEPSITHLPYGADMPKDRKVSTLLGGRGMQYFLGNFGASTVAVIDPQDARPFRLIDLPMRRVHFAIDPIRVKYAYVFTEDGTLHQVNVLSAAIARSVKLTEPYSMDGHWSEPRPRIAVAGDEIFVTDPLKGTIHVLDADNFEPSRQIKVEGHPFNIVAVGGSGAVHD